MILVIILAVGVMLAYSFRVFTYSGMSRSVALIERDRYYMISNADYDSVFFSDLSVDGTMLNLSTDSVYAMDSSYTTGVWINKLAFIPSCCGRLVVAFDKQAEDVNVSELYVDDIRRIISLQTYKMKENLDYMLKQQGELEYYFRTHSVMDDGYSGVSRFSFMLENKIDSVKGLLSKLEDLAKCDTISFECRDRYFVFSDSGKVECAYLEDLKTNKLVCLDSVRTVDFQLNVIRTKDSWMPEKAKPVSLPFIAYKLEKTDYVFISSAFTDSPRRLLSAGGQEKQKEQSEIVRGVFGFAIGDSVKSKFVSGSEYTECQVLPVFGESGRFLGLTVY